MGWNRVFSYSTRGVPAAHCLVWAFGRRLSLLPAKKACQPVPRVLSPPWHLQAWRRCNGPRSVGTYFRCLASLGSLSFTPWKVSLGVGRWIFLTPPATLDTSTSPVESQHICGCLYKCSFKTTLTTRLAVPWQTGAVVDSCSNQSMCLAFRMR